MSRITNIIAIKVTPRADMGGRSLFVRCVRGRAKWMADGTLSLKADVVDDETNRDWVGALEPRSAPFDLEISCQEESAPGEVTTTRFQKCTDSLIELQSGTARPKGPLSLRYHLKLKAESPPETLKSIP